MTIDAVDRHREEHGDAAIPARPRTIDAVDRHREERSDAAIPARPQELLPCATGSPRRATAAPRDDMSGPPPRSR